MHLPRSTTSFLLLAVAGTLALLPSVSAALCSKRFVNVGDSEISFVTQISQQSTEAVGSALPPSHSPRNDSLSPSVYFEQNSTISIYEQVAISAMGNQIAAGSWLSDDSMAEAVSLEVGKEVWKQSHEKGTFFEVSASRLGHIIVTGQFDNYGQNNSAVLTARDESGKILWNFITDGIRAGMKSLSMSFSGSILAAVLTIDASYIQPGYTRLHCMRPETGEIFSKFDVPRSPNSAFSISEVTESGVVAFIVGLQLYAFDCNNGKLLANITRNYVAATLSISPDGKQIATGFETFELWTLSSSGTFELTANVKLVNPSRPDAKLWCLQAAAYSPSSASANKFSVAIGAFDCYTAQQNFLAVFETDSMDGTASPAWEHSFPDMRNSTLQDSFSAIYFSQTGNVVATGSWGSMKDTNPTVNVFSAQTGKIVGSFNTPGSVFDIAVVEKGNTIVVAAGGKSVHANTMGRGGNLFSLSFNTPSIAFSESDFILDTLPRISVSSSWVAGRNSRFEGVTVREARRLLGTNIIPLPSVQSQSARSVDTISAIPDSFDSTKQWPTCTSIGSIRDQGQCGSCWAFAASEVLSDRVCIASKGGRNVLLSPQDMVSCDTQDFGCSGGYLLYAWEYMAKNGLASESCIPYASGSGHPPTCPSTCVDNSTITRTAASLSSVAFSGNVTQLQSEIMKNGPIQVGFDVYNDFFSYTSGVYAPSPAAVFVGGHSVKIIGWGTDETSKLPYWTVANSWSSSWGMQGFFHILRGNDTCGIEKNSIWGSPKL